MNRTGRAARALTGDVQGERAWTPPWRSATARLADLWGLRIAAARRRPSGAGAAQRRAHHAAVSVAGSAPAAQRPEPIVGSQSPKITMLIVSISPCTATPTSPAAAASASNAPSGAALCSRERSAARTPQPSSRTPQVRALRVRRRTSNRGCAREKPSLRRRERARADRGARKSNGPTPVSGKRSIICIAACQIERRV